jgi:hypothetical protein
MYSLLVKQVKYQPSLLKVNVFSTGQAGERWSRFQCLCTTLLNSCILVFSLILFMSEYLHMLHPDETRVSFDFGLDLTTAGNRVQVFKIKSLQNWYPLSMHYKYTRNAWLAVGQTYLLSKYNLMAHSTVH